MQTCFIDIDKLDEPHEHIFFVLFFFSPMICFGFGVYQIILTKIDKISNILNIKQEIEAKISMHTAAFPEILATSSEKMIGISDVQKAIATFS